MTGTYVDEIDVHITEQYTKGAFSSCKNVQFPSSGQLALDLMCGDWGASRCSASRWFTYMGNAEGNVFIPFQINYRYHNSSAEVDGFTPMNPRIVPCNESVDVRKIVEGRILAVTCSFFNRARSQHAHVLIVPHRVQSRPHPSLFHKDS